MASTTQGEVRRGELEAGTEKEAEEALWKAGLTILRLKRRGEGLRLEALSPTLFGVKREEVIYFAGDPSWQLEVDEFVSCIRTGGPVQVGSSKDAREIMELVYRIYAADPVWSRQRKQHG